MTCLPSLQNKLHSRFNCLSPSRFTMCLSLNNLSNILLRISYAYPLLKFGTISSVQCLFKSPAAEHPRYS